MKKFLLLIVCFFCLNFKLHSQANEPGDTVPDFTYSDIYGVEHNLYSYLNDGKYVVLDLFGTFCIPCLDVVAPMHDFYVKYGCNEGDLIVLGIEIDPYATMFLYETFRNSAWFTAGRPIPEHSYPVILGSQGGDLINQSLGNFGVPNIVVVGPDKTLQFFLGPEGEFPAHTWSVVGFENSFPENVLNPMDCSQLDLDENNINIGIEINVNLSESVLTIEGESIQKIQISDVTGKKILSNSFNNSNKISISLSGFSQGFYFVNVLSKKGVFSEKIYVSN